MPNDREIDRDAGAALRFSLGWSHRAVREADTAAAGPTRGARLGVGRLQRIKRTGFNEGLLRCGSGATDRRGLCGTEATWLISLVRNAVLATRRIFV